MTPTSRREAFLAHLEYAFLIFSVPLADRSERRRRENPRKLYLADHGLALAFSPVAGLDRGRLIENLVACELARVSRDLADAKTAAGFGVDFLATDFEGRRQLIQVAADIPSPATFEREIRALTEAAKDFPDAATTKRKSRAKPSVPSPHRNTGRQSRNRTRRER